MKKIIRVGSALIDSAPFKLAKNIDIFIENNIIKEISPAGKEKQIKDVYFTDLSDFLATPGFIQPHIHLCQTIFRGLADDMELLDWLYKVTFPMESAHSEKSIRTSSQIGISELFRSGTTTIMDMGTIKHEEAIIEEIHNSGLRAVVGKAMMDINDFYPVLKESTKDSLISSENLMNLVNNKYADRISYAFTPRFILSCTYELLIDAFELSKKYKTLYHTHASENKKELDAVYKRCSMGNIEYFDKIRILDENTCLAHCIWLNDNEIEIMKNRKSKVLHCPSSNLKLGSGIAKIPAYLEKGIEVSIAADGAPCNNNLSMLTEMRLAALIQKPFSPLNMKAETVFELATMGGARVLGKQNEIGSIEVGKKADLVFWDLNRSWNNLKLDTPSDLFSSIVYSAKEENIHSVMVDGNFVMINREIITIDEKKALAIGKEELKRMLDSI